MSEYSSDKILQAKNNLDEQLAYFIANYPKDKNNKTAIQESVTKLITEHSNVLSTINIAIGKTHQESDFFLSKDLQSDYLVTIENFLLASFQVIDTVIQIIIKHKLTKYSVDDRSYETIQRLVNTFASSDGKKALKKSLKKEIFRLKDFIKNSSV
jgi:hypothetical protein